MKKGKGILRNIDIVRAVLPIASIIVAGFVTFALLQKDVVANRDDIVEMKTTLRQVTENQTKILLIQQRDQQTEKDITDIKKDIGEIKEALNKL